MRVLTSWVALLTAGNALFLACGTDWLRPYDRETARRVMLIDDQGQIQGHFGLNSDGSPEVVERTGSIRFSSARTRATKPALPFSTGARSGWIDPRPLMARPI